MPDDKPDEFERVAMEIRTLCYDLGPEARDNLTVRILRHEFGEKFKRLTEMHTTADEAAKVWMARAQKDEREIDELRAELARATEALDRLGSMEGPYCERAQILTLAIPREDFEFIRKVREELQNAHKDRVD
jgi:hypothetical protein